MLTRWFFARHRAAQNALNEGRIDEAFERLNRPGVRDDRRAQKLLEELAEALLARARVHAQAGRYRDALADLGRLESLRPLGEEAQTLKRRVEVELDRRVARHAEERGAYNRAAQAIDAGRLESGRLAVDRLEDPGRREQLREQLDIRAQRSGELLEQAQEALERGDVLGACRAWEQACSRHGHTRESNALAARLVPAVRKQLDQWFDAGRLDALRAALDATAALRATAAELAECSRLSDLVCRAGRQLDAMDYGGLRETLLRLRAARGDTRWIGEALGALDRIVDAQAALLSSPLGWLGHSHRTADAKRERGSGAEAMRGPARHADMRAAGECAEGDRGAQLGAEPLLLLIDGTGSALLVPRDVVRIGRAGGINGIDVPIPADIQSHHADILRDGDDYFLVAHGPAAETASRWASPTGSKPTPPRNSCSSSRAPKAHRRCCGCRAARGCRWTWTGWCCSARPACWGRSQAPTCGRARVTRGSCFSNGRGGCLCDTVGRMAGPPARLNRCRRTRPVNWVTCESR
jgi:tetratricopeptide (TPR) repeat protein